MAHDLSRADMSVVLNVCGRSVQNCSGTFTFPDRKILPPDRKRFYRFSMIKLCSRVL